MVEIICVLTASFVHHERGGMVRGGEEAQGYGRYFIATEGMCHF